MASRRGTIDPGRCIRIACNFDVARNFGRGIQLVDNKACDREYPGTRRWVLTEKADNDPPSSTVVTISENLERGNLGSPTHRSDRLRCMGLSSL
jgi:hypothetical protein